MHESCDQGRELHRSWVAGADALSNSLERPCGRHQLFNLQYDFVWLDNETVPDLGFVRTLGSKIMLTTPPGRHRMRESGAGVIRTNHPINALSKQRVVFDDLNQGFGSQLGDVGKAKETKNVDEAVTALATSQFRMRIRRIARMQPERIRKFR